MTSLAAAAPVLLRPGDADYEDATSLFNAAIENRPDVVARVRSNAEVAAALSYAQNQGLRVTVRGGGHGVAGLATAGRLVIDLSLMRDVTVDAHARTAVVEGGCTWVDVDSATQRFGLATPGGRVTHTGVAGLTLGGGQGWLSPKLGLSCDNLVEAEVVTADGSVVTAGPESEPELLWALRGGGPFAGVVTRFKFALHPVGPNIVGGLVLHRLEQADEVVSAYQRLVEEAGPDLGGAVVFATAPPAPFVPPEVVGSQVLITTLAWFGDLGEGARLLRGFRTAHHPVVDAVGPMTYLQLQAMTDAANPRGLRNHWSAGYADRLTPDMIAALAEASSERTSPFSAIVVTQMGAAVNAVPEAATAFPNRHAGWLVHPLAMWTDPDDDEQEIGWIRRTRSALAPYQQSGSYLNTDSAQADRNRVRNTYGAPKSARLAACGRSTTRSERSATRSRPDEGARRSTGSSESCDLWPGNPGSGPSPVRRGAVNTPCEVGLLPHAEHSHSPEAST